MLTEAPGARPVGSGMVRVVFRPPPGTGVAGASTLRFCTVSAVPPVMVIWLVGVAGLMTRNCPGTGGWAMAPGSGGPLASLRLVMRISAAVMAVTRCW